MSEIITVKRQGKTLIRFYTIKEALNYVELALEYRNVAPHNTSYYLDKKDNNCTVVYCGKGFDEYRIYGG